MVRRDTFNNCAAWSIETLRPKRGSIAGDSGLAVGTDNLRQSIWQGRCQSGSATPAEEKAAVLRGNADDPGSTRSRPWTAPVGRRIGLTSIRVARPSILKSGLAEPRGNASR